MTKKHFANIGIILSALLFILFIFYLPVEVAGQRPGMSRALIINSGFLAIVTAVVIVFVLVVITKKEFVQNQISTFLRFRHLLALMVKRDFVTRYRRSVLGVMWSLLNPLLTMLVLTMVFSAIFRFEIEHFPVYLLSGQLIFGFFSESTNQAMGSIVGGSTILKKNYVPKYILPLSKVLSSMVNIGFSLIAFFIVFFVTRVPFQWTIFLIPIPLLYVLVFSLGIGLFLSAIAVFFRDLTYIYGVFVTLLTYLTPIFYPVEILPERVFHLIHLNPMFHYVDYFRELAINGNIPGLWSNIICIGFALAALCLGLYTKISQQDKYILYL